MSDWMDDGWNEFASEHRVAMADLSVANVQLLKEAWLHGARRTIRRALKKAVGNFMESTQEIAP